MAARFFVGLVYKFNQKFGKIEDVIGIALSVLTPQGQSGFFGFKLHTLTDAVTKIVLHDIFTPANIHDVNLLLELCKHAPESMIKIYADSGYCSEDMELGPFAPIYRMRGKGREELALDSV